MKNTFTTLLMLVIATVSSYATVYYSVGSVVPTTVTNWKTNTDGTGTSPTNFTAAGDVFVVQVGHEMTIATNGSVWDISGAGSTLRVLGKLTAGKQIMAANFEVANGGTYVNNVAQVMPGSTAITLGETSTVEIKSYLSSAVLPAITWGNLIINISLGAEWVMNDQSSFETKGDLIIRKTGSAITRVVRLSPNTGTFNLTAIIGGDLIVEGGILALSANNDAASINNNYKLLIKGNFVIEDKGTADYGANGTIAELRLSSANSYTATFSFTVDGNTEIKKGSFIISNVATNASPNINMDFKGNFIVDATGVAILSKAVTGSGTIKAISMIIGGNMEVNGTFTGTSGTPWTTNYGGATVYFKGGAASSTFKMAVGQGTTNIAYIVGKDKTLDLQSDITTDKFWAVAGTVVGNGHAINGTINTLVNPATIAFNGDITANAQSKITLQDGATVSGLGLIPGMEITSLAGNILAPNTVITQIVDESTITISRAAVNGATAYAGAGADPANFNNASNAGVLPLTLVSFTAARALNGVKLQWKTAQESNVKQIVVERSTDGAAFAVVAVLNAYNSAGEHIYSYLDKVASTNQNNYYRLRIEDYDGSATYSKEAVVNPLALTASEIKLYPNPVNSYLEVNFPTVVGNGYIKVLSVDGSIVKQETVSKGQVSLRVDASSFAKGLYLLVYEDGSGKRYTSRFIKN